MPPAATADSASAARRRADCAEVSARVESVFREVWTRTPRLAALPPDRDARFDAALADESGGFGDTPSEHALSLREHARHLNMLHRQLRNAVAAFGESSSESSALDASVGVLPFVRAASEGARRILRDVLAETVPDPEAWTATLPATAKETVGVHLYNDLDDRDGFDAARVADAEGFTGARFVAGEVPEPTLDAVAGETDVSARFEAPFEGSDETDEADETDRKPDSAAGRSGSKSLPKSDAEAARLMDALERAEAVWGEKLRDQMALDAMRESNANQVSASLLPFGLRSPSSDRRGSSYASARAEDIASRIANAAELRSAVETRYPSAAARRLTTRTRADERLRGTCAARLAGERAVPRRARRGAPRTREGRGVRALPRDAEGAVSARRRRRSGRRRRRLRLVPSGGGMDLRNREGRGRDRSREGRREGGVLRDEGGGMKHPRNRRNGARIAIRVVNLYPYVDRRTIARPVPHFLLPSQHMEVSTERAFSHTRVPDDIRTRDRRP